MADLRELNQLIVDSIQSGLMIADADGRILYVNAFGERRSSGGPPPGCAGRGLSDVLGSPLLEPTAAARPGPRPRPRPARALLPTARTAAASSSGSR